MSRPDPHSYFVPSQGPIEHVHLSVKVDFDTRTIRGKASYRLSGPSTGELHLDTRGIKLESAKDSTGKDAAFRLDAAEGFMGERLRVTLPEGETRFEIAFETGPDASALQWLSPGNTAGGEHPFMFSQCQPIHARSILPVQDSPAVRFSYTAEVTVPKGLKPVMSASAGELRSSKDGFDTYRFDMPQPIPSYLLALAVGNLDSADLGPRSTVYAEPETMEAATYEFAKVEDMIVAAEGIFGPYLWDRFDFVVMPPAFPYGGMENPRLTFLTPTLLAGDRSLTNVLAHELAHSWTGNLVTNATMNDFWLNEGFTVWAERRILEVLEGEDEVSLSAALGRIGLEEAISAFGETSPLTRLETDLAGTDPDEVYSLVPYEKGFLFVARLEEILGRADMDAFVHEYIERFKFQSINTARFEAFVEEARPGLMAKVNADEWIHGEGLPSEAPVFVSKRLDELKLLASRWTEGARPAKDDIDSWSASQRQVFIQELPRSMSDDECAVLASLMGTDEQANAEILNSWLIIAATSGYRPAFPQIESFLGHVGRMKYLKPIYTALAKNPETLDLGRKIYSQNKEKYHPIARGGLEKILA